MKKDMINNILKEGTVVSTRLNNSQTWFQNIIYSVNNNRISIALIDSYLESFILVDSVIIIKYTEEYFEYMFNGTVAEINAQFPGIVTVTINKADEIINSRTFPRYDKYIPSILKPLNENGSYFSIISNISLTGMAFLSNHDFGYGEIVEVSIHLPEYKTVTCKGKIIRRSIKTHYMDYSMQFVEMDEKNSNTLSGYMASLEDQVNKLKENYFSYIKGLLSI